MGIFVLPLLISFLLSGQQNGLGASRPSRRGERLLLAPGELNPVPRGHPAGHLLLQRPAEVHELRRYRVGHRSRDHPRVRRPGQAV